jgi:hypothetical protein
LGVIDWRASKPALLIDIVNLCPVAGAEICNNLRR